MPASPYWCCCASGSCDCTLRDTVYGQTIDTGCCHLDDELLLWCNRPGFSNTIWQRCLVGELHYKVEWAECLPIVALYKYFGCFYRVAYPPPLQGAEALCNLPRKCSVSGCSGPPPSGTTICEPGNVDWDFTLDPCCQANPFPADCNCGHTWLSDRRRFVMQDGDVRYPSPCKWLDEMACYAGGASVCGSGSLYQQFLGVVYFERHWKIPDGVWSKDFCPPGVRIYIPPCDNCTEEYNPNPSTAVPYWFAYAGAGVPLFLCDVDDALQHGVISAQEYTDLLTALYSRVQPDQAVLCKMRDYFTPGDWRDEQVAAWQQLDDRFPEAGYGNCPSAPCDLPLLGPFRKRCVPTQCVTNQQACLRRSLMTPTHQQLNPVCGEIPYPGACSGEGAAADFAYWRDRQWSYWRGVEGGWAWGCADLTPDQFLAGVGRNSLNCTLALQNQVRCDPTYTNLPCTPTGIPCCGYNNPSCQGCGPNVGCMPFTASYTCFGEAHFVCEGLAVQPQCQGIRFNGFKYYLQTDFSQPVDPLSTCLYNAWSFLVSAKRSTRWDGTCPMSCVAQDPPYGVFNSWPELAPGVLGERIICQALDAGTATYGTASLCCGNHCPQSDANNCIWFEELEGTTSIIRNPCVPTTQCPPTLTADQQNCLGYNPSCP